MSTYVTYLRGQYSDAGLCTLNGNLASCLEVFLNLDKRLHQLLCPYIRVVVWQQLQTIRKQQQQQQQQQQQHEYLNMH